MRHRSIRWWIVGLLTLALALQPDGARAQGAQRGVYLALGDSLASGVGATDPARLGYVARLFEFFHGTAHGGVNTLVNLGVGGETSTSMVKFIPNTQRIDPSGQLGKALAAVSDPATNIRVVTLDIGGNDLLTLLNPGEPCVADPNSPTCRQALAAALATFAGNYAFILAQLTAALANDPGPEKLLVMTYYNQLSGTGDPFESILDAALLGPDLKIDCAAPQNTWGLNDIITCLGTQSGAAVAKVYPRFAGKGRTLTHVQEGGNFHPTNAGYAMIANTFMDVSR